MVSYAIFFRTRPADNSAGVIRFIGTTQFAEGEWFGVELEKPLGKNDPQLDVHRD